MHEMIPGLTAAEADLLERYVRILKPLARLKPARTASTDHGCLVGAQALVSEARRSTPPSRPCSPAVRTRCSTTCSREPCDTCKPTDRHLARLHLLE